MKVALSIFAIGLATGVSIFAQTQPAGTWRAGLGQFTWEVVLRVDGSRLTGAVSSCASRRVEIHDGSVNGNTVAFKCRSLDGDRIYAFTGTINGDEMSIARDVQVRDGGHPLPPNISPVDDMFGPSAPPRFIAKRVPNGDLAEATDQVRGVTLAAAVNSLQRNVKSEATLFLPGGIVRVRAVIVAMNWGLGGAFYNDQQVRRLLTKSDAALLFARFSNIGPSVIHDAQPQEVTGGAGEGLVSLLQRLGSESGHPELAEAPLLFWGHSAAGPFGTIFAKLYPQRTIAFVRYHSGPVGGGDMKVLAGIPALFFVGGKDATAAAVPLGDGKALWRSGRAAGAPWTFAVEPEATHGDPKDLAKANDLMIPWISSVLRQRLPSSGVTLRPVTDRSAWLGNNRTGEVASYSTFSGSKAEATWLPDEASAQGWRLVMGAEK